MKKKSTVRKSKTDGSKSKSDSTMVAGKVNSVGLKKKTDNSTSYNKKAGIHNIKTKGYPYGQLHKSTKAVQPKKRVGPVKKK